MINSNFSNLINNSFNNFQKVVETSTSSYLGAYAQAPIWTEQAVGLSLDSLLSDISSL